MAVNPWIVLICGVGLLFAMLAWGQIAKLRRQLRQARELAEHREYERNLAQEELLRRLEGDRELVKEKMQFESQLSSFEKYASVAQLALGAAHEINNPLLGILSHLELERREATAAERRDEIEECIAAVRRISTAVQGLLNYARPAPLKLQKLNLSALVAENIVFLERQPLFQQLELRNCVPADLPSIMADSTQLSQALTNLLLNAAQATPPGGVITVLAQKVRFSDFIELRVCDTGCGIPAEVLPHVFEPFFTTKRGRGTGLGLSITQGYVRSHGGDVHIESIPGSGTTVRITLPIQQPASEPEMVEEVTA